MPYSAPTYASVSDLVSYTEGLTAPAPASAEENRIKRIITRAEDQIDALLCWGGAAIEQTTPTAVFRRVDPAALTPLDAHTLRQAVCAQAEYRLAKGEDFFTHAQHSRVAGPEFETSGALPVIGPKVWQELSKASRELYRTGGTAYSGAAPDPDEDLWA